MSVSGHLGSLPNSGEQHVPPGAFCLFPSMFPSALYFSQTLENKQLICYLLCSLPHHYQVRVSPLPPFAFTNCILPQVTPILYLCPSPSPSHLACPALTHFFTSALSPTPLPYLLPISCSQNLNAWWLNPSLYSHSLLIQKVKLPIFLTLHWSHHPSLFHHLLPSYSSPSHNRFFNWIYRFPPTIGFHDHFFCHTASLPAWRSSPL